MHMLRKLPTNSTTISVDSIQCMGKDHQQMVHASDTKKEIQGSEVHHGVHTHKGTGPQ